MLRRKNNRPLWKKIEWRAVPWLVSCALLLTLLSGVWLHSSPLLAQADQGIFAVAGAQGADLHEAPGGAVLEALLPGATMTAVGRTADSQWIAVAVIDGKSGWVTATTIVIFGEEGLPVLAEEPAAAEVAASVTAAVTSAVTAAVTPTSEADDAPAQPTVPPTATATPMPTATPTELPPTPTPVPPTPTPLPPTTTPTVGLLLGTTELIAVVGSNGATLYPAVGAESGSTLAVGTALTAVGRTADGRMLSVRTDEGATGWVMTNSVVAFNTRSLPVAGDAADEESAETMASATVAEQAAAATTTPLPPTVTAPPTATATATATPLPTATPTQAMRPTPNAEGRTTAQVAMSGSRLNIRSGPSTEFPIIGKALPREIFVAQGRNGDSSWVQIEVADIEGGFGWVTARLVRLTDPIASLPIALTTNNTAAPVSAAIAQRLATASAQSDPPSASAPAPATTGGATAAGGTARSAALPGKMVIQTQWGGTFYLYNPANGTLQPVAGGLDPALSPDGTRIAFTRIGGSAGGLYVINSDGSGEQQIFGAQEQIMAPKWSPDGEWIVFSRSNGSYTCNDIAFVGCLSDGELFPVPPGGLPPALAEARDEVLDNFERVSRPNWQISRVNPRGKEYRDLPALNSARAPDWTTAGIVYQSSGGIQITEDTPDGETRKIYHDGWDWDPDWQPGGGRIVFQSKEGPHWEIFGVNPDGSGLAALTRPVTTLVDELPSNVSPVWSPDGQFVAYLSNRTASNEAGPWRVWVMNGDGSNQRPLPIDLEITYGYAGEQMISWER